LADDLHIHFASDTVSFHLGDQVKSLAPIVQVAAEPGSTRVLSFGASAGPGPTTVQVDLFKPGGTAAGGPDKLACLTAFLQHGMTSLWNRRFVAPKPRVIVHGISRLGPIMGGYEQGLVVTALHAAGVSSVGIAAD
jgi:hypothetical protein